MVNIRWYEWKSGDLLLKLQVQAKAGTNKFTKVIEDRIKLRIKAPAENGKANDAILKFFSKEFRVPKSSVEILCGKKSTRKTVRIQTPSQLPELPGLQRIETKRLQRHKEL